MCHINSRWETLRGRDEKEDLYVEMLVNTHLNKVTHLRVCVCGSACVRAMHLIWERDDKDNEVCVHVGIIYINH